VVLPVDSARHGEPSESVGNHPPGVEVDVATRARQTAGTAVLDLT
jgi:hypothetical protein